MADITMCNAPCSFSKECKRHPDSGTYPDTEWQSWGLFVKNGTLNKPEHCIGWLPKDNKE